MPSTPPGSDDDQDVAVRAFEASRPVSDDSAALSAMRSLQRRLFDVEADSPRLGRYELVGRIGEGATGVVYEARDVPLDRVVALKVMSGDGGDPSRRQEHHERLRREANTLAKLSHPNIVQVYDVGELDGRTYIAMEYVSGGDLARWLSAQSRPWTEIVEVIAQAGRGLAAAHDAGLIHCDVKPSNILMSDDGRVLVGDFGLAEKGSLSVDLASIAPGQPLEEALQTMPNKPLAVAGTPGYMAPEQVFGELVDVRADVFGLCVTLWEALYGQRPYSGRTLAQMAQVFAVGTETPRGSRAGVPGWLRRVCRQGLATIRHHRWSSMHELVEALEGGQARARRRRLVAISVAAAAIAGTGWWLLASP